MAKRKKVTKKDKDRFEAAVASIAEDFVNEGMLKKLRGSAIPRTLNLQIKKAVRMHEENSLIQPIIDTVVNFTVAGFHNQTDDPKAKKYYNEICEKYNFDGVVLQMAGHLTTTDNNIFHWKKSEDGEIEYVMTLDPRLVEVVPLFGKSHVYVKPDQALKNLVKSTNDQEQEFKNQIPTKWKDAVNNKGEKGHKDQVLLSEEDREYCIVANTKGRSDRMVKPSMCAIFYDLSLRDLLIDGDASVAYHIKNLITQIKAGESIDSGPMAGSKKNWAKQKDLNELKKKFKTVSKAIRIFTQHHVSIEHKIPDIAVFGASKYAAVNRRIVIWGGVGLGLLIGEGGNYAVMYIHLKKLIAKIRKIRRIIKRNIEKFYNEIKEDAPSHIKVASVPKVAFDKQMLKEPRQLMEEIRTLLQQGPLSIETALEVTGYSPRIEKSRKTEELENIKGWMPLYERGAGMVPMVVLGEENPRKKKPNDGQPGRPAEKAPNAPIEQHPRPSTSEMAEMIEVANEVEPDLAPISTLPKEAMKLWERVYRERIKAGASRQSAARQAWSVIKKSWKKVGNKWVKKKVK